MWRLHKTNDNSDSHARTNLLTFVNKKLIYVDLSIL